jgi:hypothetical protein
MRIAYLTTDEVNEQRAQQMAADCGITLCSLAPKDAPPNGEYDAVLYDWDYWPAGSQREVLAELLSGPLTHPVALHGYNLQDAQAEALPRHGVAVYRRLHPQVFRFLRRAALAVWAAGVLGSSPHDESATSRRGGAARAAH